MNGAFHHLQDANFVLAQKDVLEVYKKPYDPKQTKVCMDEFRSQLIKEVRQPISAQPGEPERYDTEYERNFV